MNALGQTAPLLEGMRTSLNVVDKRLREIEDENARIAKENGQLLDEIAALQRELADAREAVHELRQMNERGKAEQ